MEPIVARKTWRTAEPIHGMIYFAPEADAAYRAIGLDGNPQSYFASRGAAMGPVAAESVIATFYNFNPAIVRDAIPAAWSKADPATILDARRDAADAALRRILGDGIVSRADVVDAAELARAAALAACARPQGRALFAAHAALAWPDEPHLVLWHAQTLLREFRGDGHVAALLAANLDAVEALVTHAAAGDVPAAALQSTRAWPDDDWNAGAERLQARGLLEPNGLTFTASGAALRQQIEDETDASAVVPYEAIGEDGCRRLRELTRPLSQAIVEAGLTRPPTTR
jgi:hypothetical protein